jgi:trans-aconitate 2-methyltransferase
VADCWNPQQYERFRDERSRPFHDLLALVQPQAGMRAVDLGCGTGELTRELHERLGCTETLGLDNSAAMLERSAQHAVPADGDAAGLHFELGDVAQFAAMAAAAPGAEVRYDLVFSNAALHWLPDHASLLAQLTAAVAPPQGDAPGGQLAVQMPANGDHASQYLAAEVAQEAPFAAALDGFVRVSPVLPPEDYAVILHRLGYRWQSVRLQIYTHLLDSRDDVAEWTRGSLLTDYEKRLSPELFAQFVTRYSQRLREALPDERPYFYTFKRVLIWARR